MELSSRLAKLPEISSYIEKLEGINGKKVYYCFVMPDTSIQRIFSNLVNRDIVEEEFLKKGLQLQKLYKIIKGYILWGYNLTPSFGFELILCY